MRTKLIKITYFVLSAILFLSIPPVSANGIENNSSTEGYSRPYKFTENWFTDKIPVWTEILKEFTGKPDVTYLEVGTFEGRSSLWLLENILTHPTSKIIIVDAFQENTFKTFSSNINLSGQPAKFKILPGYSTE